MRLLKRYELHRDSRLRTAFIDLNELSEKSVLIKGKKYTLPVRLYHYNGKSIRSTIKDNDWNRAVRIKKYNESLLDKGSRTTHYSKSKILWVPITELEEIEITGNPVVVSKKPIKVEPKPSKKKFIDIYGKNNNITKLKDNSLAGKVYYVVSGHGGPDPGARCDECERTLCEDEYAYDVGLRLCRNLLEHGATVYMIIRDPDDGLREGQYLECDRDEYCWGNKVIPLNQKKRLKQRAVAVNDLYQANLAKGIRDQTLVTIHIDSRSKGQKTDVFFYHYPKSQSSKRLAMDIHKTFKEKYAKNRRDGSYHGTVTGRDLYMLRYTDPRAVFIELGNIRNSRDQKRFLYETNRDALAKWLYEGLTKR